MAPESGNTSPALNEQAQEIVQVQQSAPQNEIDQIDQPDQPKLREIRKLLDQEPFRVQFFQAVRMLQRIEAPAQAGGVFCHSAGRGGAFCLATYAGLSRQPDSRDAAAGERPA